MKFSAIFSSPSKTAEPLRLLPFPGASSVSSLILSISVQLMSTVLVLGSNDDGNGNENGKKAISLDWQNNFARASRSFCTFLCRHFTTTTWKCLISRFVENVNARLNDFLFFFFWTSIPQSFRIQLQKKLPTFWRIERDGISAIKFEAVAWLNVSSDVFVAVAVDVT